jgi:hypothetical protein
MNDTLERLALAIEALARSRAVPGGDPKRSRDVTLLVRGRCEGEQNAFRVCAEMIRAAKNPA